MKQPAKEAVLANKSENDQIKSIAKHNPDKANVLVWEAAFLLMPELWLRKLFPRVIFLSGKLPEKR